VLVLSIKAHAANSGICNSKAGRKSNRQPMSRPEIGLLKITYFMDLKTQIITEYLTQGVGFRKLAKKYGISRTTICKWVAIHQGIYNLPPTEKQKRYSTSSMNSLPKKSSSNDQSDKELQQKIAALEKQLEWEKLRSEALDTMIDIAEKDLNIPIRKKPGAQQ
jgi:transposase-like protein